MSDKVTVVLEVEVNQDWIEFCTQFNDLFMYDYCGYWMAAMECDDDLGWLCYEYANDDDMPSLRAMKEAPEYQEIVKSWREGKLLPPNWYRLDKAAAIKAYGEGVKRYGLDWYEDGDAITYDVAVQMALLGEVRYG